MIIEQEIHVAAPKLADFEHFADAKCQACGHRSGDAWSRFLRKLKGKTPRCCVSLSHCAGGKMPEAEDEPKDAGLMVISMMGDRERPTADECTGIFEPHLHMRCMACGFGWLMRTKVGS